jgi:hypothetical protein
MSQVRAKKISSDHAMIQVHNNDTALTGYLIFRTKSVRKPIGYMMGETFGKTRAVVDVITDPVVSAAKAVWQTISKCVDNIVGNTWTSIKRLFS